MSKVTGWKETARAIRRAAQFPRGKVGAASRKALTPMLNASKANLRKNKSYKQGVLSRSMRIRALKSGSALSQWVVSATGRGVAIAHLVELGTRPHWQPRRNRMHPGADAKPFLEPAYLATDELAIKIMADEIGVGLIKFAASVGYRGK